MKKYSQLTKLLRYQIEVLKKVEKDQKGISGISHKGPCRHHLLHITTTLIRTSGVPG